MKSQLILDKIMDIIDKFILFPIIIFINVLRMLDEKFFHTDLQENGNLKHENEIIPESNWILRRKSIRSPIEAEKPDKYFEDRIDNTQFSDDESPMMPSILPEVAIGNMADELSSINEEEEDNLDRQLEEDINYYAEAFPGFNAAGAKPHFLRRASIGQAIERRRHSVW